MNQVWEWGITILSDKEFLCDENCVRLFYVIDDLSLMVINTVVLNFAGEKDVFRVGTLQTLSLEKL